MDAESIATADDDVLWNMGICTRGDILTLRGFPEEKCSKKRDELVKFLKMKRYAPPTASSKGAKDTKKRKRLQSKSDKTRHLEIGWLHQRSSSDEFEVFRGGIGGTRNVDAPKQQKMGHHYIWKRLFSLGGKSALCSEDDNAFNVGNFAREKVGPTVLFLDRSEHPFNS